MNVLTISLDDVGWDDIYHPEARIPNLKRYMQEGRVYTNHWGSHACSPQRARFLQGRYHTGVGSILRKSSTSGFSMDTDTFAKTLKDNGVSTFHSGKWHLAANGNHQHVLECGFTDCLATLFNLGNYFDWEVFDGVSVYQSSTYATTEQTSAALTVLGSYQYINLAYSAPHVPIQEPPPYLHTFGDWSLLSDQQKRFAILEAADLSLSRVVNDAVEADYLVAITSDNGGHGGNKGEHKDITLRVPLIVKGNGVVPGESTCFVDCVDLAPTILDIFRVVDPTLDGESFLADIFYETGTDRDFLYNESYQKNGHPDPISLPGFTRSIRFGNDWMVVNRPQGENEVYDRLVDPNEDNNIVDTPIGQTILAQGIALMP